MKRTFAFLLLILTVNITYGQQATSNEVLQTARKVNIYFMRKYADPTEATNVGRVRPSNLYGTLWHRPRRSIYSIHRPLG